MILTIDDVIDIVDNWKSNNNIVGDLNSSQLSKFTSDIRAVIDQMDFAIANDSSVVLYSGESGSVRAWRVVDSAEDLSATINNTRQRITEETDKLIEVTQIVAKGNKAVDDIQPLYSQFVSWADEFRQATLEQKRIILSQLIDCIEIGRDYTITVKMNASYEQFCEWGRQ